MEKVALPDSLQSDSASPPRLRGVVPVLCTPFLDDEGLDEDGLLAQIEFAAAQGANALCAPAFGSEYYKLTHAERLRVAELLARHSRVPALINCGAGSLRETVAFCDHAASIGAAAIMVAPPSTVPLGAEEIRRFYEAVCRNVRLPLMLQDSDFSGAGLPLELFVRLSEQFPQFRYAKLENPLAGTKCRRIIEQSRGRVQVMYGWGGMRLFDGLDHGAAGIMPGAAMTRLYVRIMDLYQSGSTTQAQSLFEKLLPLLVFSLQHLELFISMEKRMLTRLGVFKSARLREPTLHLEDEYERRLQMLMDQVLAEMAAIAPR